MRPVTVYIDGRPYSADGEQNLLDVCLSLGIDLPYFCYHPAMGSVGACRQCAVKQFRDEHDQKGRLVMACMTPATEGARIAVADPEAQRFRQSVIEWLMVNHPHDCPVCDEGGECHLQDMTVMTGHDYRRYRFTKRTYRNQDLGPFINHEMNRCIQCYRCVRFYRDYAGGRDFNVFGAHDNVYFGRHRDGTLESPFSGNLVEVCPTGVFTDKTLKRHYTRKWDLTTSPSICVHCAVGCNTLPGAREGQLRRIRNRYHRDVNGYFLCDRGRYGYEFVNHPERLRAPLLRQDRDGALLALDRDTLRRRLARLQRGRLIGIGSPRASLEANFALRTLVGPDRFCPGFSARTQRLLQLALALARSVPLASVREVESADAALVLGEDASQVAPRLALALRQLSRQAPLERAGALGIPRWHDAALRELVQEARGPLFLATPVTTPLDELATGLYRGAPADVARFAWAVARALGASVPGLKLAPGVEALADRAAHALAAASHPLLVAGITGGSELVLKAATEVLRARPGLPLALVLPECNSLGAALMEGLSLEGVLEALRGGAADTLVVVENDLFTRVEEPVAAALCHTARQLIVVDHQPTETVRRADLALPAATFAESTGTLVSSEGRAQRFFETFKPDGQVQPSWRWLVELDVAIGGASFATLDELGAVMAEALPALAAAVAAAPPASYRQTGQRIPRQPHRFSGRTALVAAHTLHEPPPPRDANTPLSHSMEGSPCQPPSALLPRFWAPGWNSIQSLTRFQEEIHGPLRGGEAGVRLFAPADSLPESSTPPPAFSPRPDTWLLVPRYSLFGGEELSRRAPGITARAPVPTLFLHPDDAPALKLTERVILTVEDRSWELALELSAAMPRGLAAVLHDLPAMRGLVLPAWGVLAAP